MRRWLLLVQPLPGIVPIALALHAAFVGWIAYMEWRIGQNFPADDKLRFLLVSFPGLATFAAWRVVGFHPFCREGLKNWLKATPWSGSQPLPFGPVHLVVQDLILVGVALLLNWIMAGPYVWPSFLFFPIVYLLTLTAVLFLTGAWQHGYAAGFGIGLIVFLRVNPIESGLAVLATYGVALWGLRVSLVHFPWDQTWYGNLPKEVKPRPKTDSPTDEVGWPMSHIAPQLVASRFRVPLVHALLSSLLAGWIYFVTLSFWPTLADRCYASKILCLVVVGPVPFVRLMIYAVSYANPVGLQARWSTGQWLVPGYDRVLIIPLLALSVGIVGSGILLRLPEWGVIFTSPIIVALVIYISLSMGQDLREWQLTGKHTLRRGGSNATDIKAG
ncbi:MAG TPA: hypothetical protein VGP68_14640 [Gemmataceae bacterium]|jgi:hypothetical protein|nr:hypothetical protein [Gemmataceae bacterium]